MRSLILHMHISLDGFVAGLNGELNWITINEEIFDFVGMMTDKADTGVYGRKTYEIMQAYWPTAADKPNATKHDKEHAVWYKNSAKIVLSKTMNDESFSNTSFIKENIRDYFNQLKNTKGKNMIIFGSPSAAESLLTEGLIDELMLFVNPIILGKGISLFQKNNETIKLKLIESKVFECGVILLHYARP